MQNITPTVFLKALWHAEAFSFIFFKTAFYGGTVIYFKRINWTTIINSRV